MEDPVLVTLVLFLILPAGQRQHDEKTSDPDAKLAIFERYPWVRFK